MPIFFISDEEEVKLVSVLRNDKTSGTTNMRPFVAEAYRAELDGLIAIFDKPLVKGDFVQLPPDITEDQRARIAGAIHAVLNPAAIAGNYLLPVKGEVIEERTLEEVLIEDKPDFLSRSQYRGLVNSGFVLMKEKENE